MPHTLRQDPWSQPSRGDGVGTGGHEEPSPRPPGLAWTQASALAPPPSGNESLWPLAGLSIPVISFENLNDQD